MSKSMNNVNNTILQDEISIIELVTCWIPGIIFYVLPINLSVIIFMIIYTIFLYLEIKFEKITPICVLLFLLSFLFFSIYYLYRKDLIFYVPIVIYFSLFFVNFLLLLLKKPFTLICSNGRGIKDLHYTVSILWTAIYLICFICSIVIFPNLFFVYVSIGLLLFGFFVTIIFNFFYFNKKSRRQNEFSLENYKIVQIKNEEEKFYSFLSLEIWKSIYNTSVFNSILELKECLKKIDEDYKKETLRFLCFLDDIPVGSIYCILGNKNLPIERDMGINLNSVNKKYKVMEIGHFAISERHKNKPIVLLLLFKAAIEVALEKDIDFIVASTYEQNVNLYEKIGFLRINITPIPDKVVGSNVYGLVLNFSNVVIFYQHTANKYSYINRLINLLNPYLMERYYKRKIISNLFRDIKVYNINVQEIFTPVFNTN